LKSSKYALLKPEINLTDKQKVKLEQVKQISPLLATLHQKKEDFNWTHADRVNPVLLYFLQQE
jgi:transposase